MKSKYLKRLVINSFIIISLTLTFGLFINNTHTTYASSWTANADKSIYNSADDSENDDSGIKVKDKKPGLIEGYLVDLVTALTDGIYKILDNIGITIDSVVYGRVGGNAKDGIAYFTFELQTGNPYGVVGAAIYAIIASIAMVFMIIITFGKFSIATFKGGNTRSRDAFKSSIGIAILSMALVVLMPFVLDLALYLRDLTLSIISSDGAKKIFDDSKNVSLIKHFRDVAVAKNAHIVDALMYLSTVLLSLYLACIYAGYAMSMLVCFLCFPTVCAGMNFDKKLLSQWVKMVFSIMIIPVMDSVLFMVPAFIGTLSGGTKLTVLKVFVCAMVVPARNVIRQILGLGSTGLDLAGVATAMGAAKLASSAGKAVGHFTGERRAARADDNMGNFYDNLAQNGQGQDFGTSNGNGGGISINPKGGAGENMAPGIMGGASSTGKVSYAGKTSNTGSTENGLSSLGQTANNVTSDSPGNPIAEKYANASNFEETAFRGQLSNQKMAQLYHQRAADRRAKANVSALGSAAGGVLGAGGGMYMSPAVSAMMGAVGIEAGGAIGNGVIQADIDRNMYRGNSGATSTMENASGTVNVASPGATNANSHGATANAGLLGTSDFSNVTVDPNYGVMNMEEAASDIATDNTFSNAADFYNCETNNAAATGTAANVVAKYSSNNGEGLSNIYNDVVKKNNGSDMKNSQIREAFKEEARKQLMNDFTQGMDSNKKIRYCSDNKVNKTGMNLFNEKFGNYLQDEDQGIMSDRYLDTFDWMPPKEANVENI